MSRFSHLMKPWIVMPAVALLALGGWGIAQSRTSSNAASAQPTEQVVTASTGTVAQTVSAQGSVEAARSEDLSFSSAGTVTAVNVKAGQTVAAGQVLAEIDSSELEADLSEAEAALAQAEAKLADDADAGASSTQLNADRTSVKTAEDRVAEARKALEAAKLVAPFDGSVAQVNITVGEELGTGGAGGVSRTGSATGSGRSGSGLGSGASTQQPGGTTASTSTPHIQLVTPSSFTVQVGIDGADIEKIAAGQSATISLSTSIGNNQGFGGRRGFAGGGVPGGGGGFQGGGALPGNAGGTTNGQGGGGGATVRNVASVTGTVSEVSSVADASSGVAKYAVTITFEDDSGDYNPGATVDVRITYAEKLNAVLVPVLAVSTANGGSTVTVAKDGSKETRTVTTGLTSGNMVEITSGLRAGDQVVVAAPTFPGMGGQGGIGQRTPPNAGGRPSGGGG